MIHKGDRVLLRDGRIVTVLQSATEDSIFQYEDEDNRVEWTDASLVDWNYTQVEAAVLDSDLMQDYN